MIKVGDVEGKRGTIQKGTWRVGSYADGSPISIPVMIAAGEQEGPVLWVQGCVHGEEYGGAAAIIRFVESLDLKQLKGTLVAVPVLNIPAFLARSRISSLDGENLNRIFPGSLQGTYSHQLAYAWTNQLAQTADYMMDLHSGGIGAMVPFYSIYVDDGSDAAKKAKSLAKSLGVQTVWKVKGEAGLLGNANSASLANKIPSVTVEVGGGNVTEEHINNYTTAITNMMKAIGMLSGDFPKFDKYTICSEGVFITNREGGLFIPTCKVEDVLKKGDMIGYIVNLYGEKVHEILNPVDNGYISAILLNYWPTEPGQLVAESLPVETEEIWED